MSELEEQVRAAWSLPSRVMRRAIRENARVSQAALALELGVARNTVVRWEKDDREPRGRLRAEYARALRQLEEAMR